MIVDDDRRFLFVHVQKTGGSTIESLLLDGFPSATRIRHLAGGRHSTMQQAVEKRPELDDYWTFGFVRNPWARLWSWHAMVLRRERAAQAGNEHLRNRIDRARFWGGVAQRYPTFEQFVMNGPDEFQRLRRPQVAYLRTPTREADFIGRTEHLETDLRRAAEHLSWTLPAFISRTNAGPASEYRTHYTPAMRQRVAQLFAADVEQFGYEF